MPGIPAGMADGMKLLAEFVVELVAIILVSLIFKESLLTPNHFSLT